MTAWILVQRRCHENSEPAGRCSGRNCWTALPQKFLAQFFDLGQAALPQQQAGMFKRYHEFVLAYARNAGCALKGGLT